MKTPLLVLLAAAALVSVSFTACEKKDDKGGLDANSKLYINGLAPQKASPAAQGALTPLEVVQQAQGIITAKWVMSIEDWNRDYANVRFAMGSGYIVTKEGELVPDMIEARNYIFITLKPGSGEAKDTVAYIPNATMKVAEKAIREAYAAGNYVECNRLFMEAFTFIPTTGKEYKALKERGEN